MRIDLSSRRLLLALVAMSLCLAACKEQNTQGSFERTADGKTYLSVDHHGRCGQLKVDGRVWPHAGTEPGLITPGPHTIECDSSKSLHDIPSGVRYRLVFLFHD